MSSLEQLKDISEQALYGLRANDQLKERILSAAEKESGGGKLISVQFSRAPRAMASLCALAAVMVLAFLGLGSLGGDRRETEVKPSTVAAGSRMAESPVSFSAAPNEADTLASELQSLGIAPGEVERISGSGIDEVRGAQACKDLLSLLSSGAEAIVGSLPQDAETLDFLLSDGRVVTVPFEENRIQLVTCWSCPAFFDALRNH